MIAKDTATIVRFYVINTDGLPATGKASSISASLSVNSGTASSISATITETDSTNLPGWYEFEYTFTTAGNAFITFSCTNCVIMPWEDEIINMASGSAPTADENAAAVWGYSSGRTVTNTIPSAADIANAVWIADLDSYRYVTTPGMAYKYITGDSAVLGNLALDVADIPDDVWGRTGNDTTSRTLTAATLKSGSLSTFNAGTDTVTINSVQAATMVTATGFATPLDIPTSDISAIKAKTDNLPSSPAATGDAMTLTSAYDAAKTASQFDPVNDTVLIDSTQAATMTTADVSNLATSTDITDAVTEIETHGDNNWTGGGSGGGGATAQQIWEYAGGRTITNTIPSVNDIWGRTGQDTTSRTLTDSPTDISGLATAADLADVATTVGAIKAKTDNLPASPAATGDIPSVADIQSGLSTFDPANDKVTLNTTEDGTLTAIKTKVDTLNNTDLTGIATSTDVSDAQTAIIGAMPTIPSDYAKSTDIAAINALLTRIDSGVLHWSTTETTLTLYDDNGDTVKTYTLTRDVQGNITRIVPNNA